MQLAWKTLFRQREERVQSPQVGALMYSKHSKEARVAGMSRRKRKIRSEDTIVWTPAE